MTLGHPQEDTVSHRDPTNSYRRLAPVRTQSPQPTLRNTQVTPLKKEGNRSSLLLHLHAPKILASKSDQPLTCVTIFKHRLIDCIFGHAESAPRPTQATTSLLRCVLLQPPRDATLNRMALPFNSILRVSTFVSHVT